MKNPDVPIEIVITHRVGQPLAIARKIKTWGIPRLKHPSISATFKIPNPKVSTPLQVSEARPVRAQFQTFLHFGIVGQLFQFKFIIEPPVFFRVLTTGRPDIGLSPGFADEVQMLTIGRKHRITFQFSRERNPLWLSEFRVHHPKVSAGNHCYFQTV